MMIQGSQSNLGISLSQTEAFRLLEEKTKVTDFTSVHQYKDYTEYATFLKSLVDASEKGRNIDISG